MIAAPAMPPVCTTSSKRPTVEKRDDRMVRVAQVGILSADARTKHGELRVHERTDERDGSADNPRADHERRRVDLARDDARVDEDPGADDAAHDDHRRVERAEAASERGFRRAGCLAAHGFAEIRVERRG